MESRKEMTPMLVFSISSAVLGMFQFGFNTGVINAPQKILEKFISDVYLNRTGETITEAYKNLIWSVAVSIFAIGGMLGAIAAPMASTRFGRKSGLVINNIIAIIGAALMASSRFAQSIECLVIGRFLIGINCGLNTALVPMYLSEISTVSMRGALGTVNQLGVTIGLLTSMVLGLKDLLGSAELWPYLFGFALVPAFLQLITLPLCPESPRYLLLSRGREIDARKALRRLRDTADIEDDIEEMRAEDRAQQEEIKKYGSLTSVRELLKQPWLRAPLIISIVMQLSQQLSGINAIFYYSTDIFLTAGIPEKFAVNATIGVGVIMVIMTLVTIPLVDRLGRRTLHLSGLSGMLFASIILTISILIKPMYDWAKFLGVFSALMFTFFFAIGPGSIPYIILSELFTQGTRSKAMSIAVLFNWLSNFLVGLTFPTIKSLLDAYVFVPFTILLAIFIIFIHKKLPETKNRTFEEIATLFKPSQDGDPIGTLPDYGCTSASN